MKNTILIILQNGFTSSKKHSLDDFVRYLYPLKHLLETCEMLPIRCNKNSFWNSANNENRLALMSDVRRMTRNNANDLYYFRIINRFQNGDKYGIDIDVGVAFSWHISDVKQERPHLTDAQAMEILEQMKNNHNAEIGVTWDVIRTTSDTLFPEGGV